MPARFRVSSRAVISGLLIAGIATPQPMLAQHGLPSSTALGPSSIVLPAGRVVVPLDLVLGGRAAIHVMVNGRGPFLFAIETGAPIVIVTARTAAAAHIVPAAHQVDPHIRWPGGSLATALTIDSLQAGGATFRDQPVFVGPDFLPGVDGLLGLPAYADLLMTVDYPGNHLVFERGALPAADNVESFGVVMLNGRLGIPVDIGGKRRPALIDTQGADDIGVTTSVAGELHPLAPWIEDGRVRIGDHEPVVQRAARLDGELRIGRFVQRGPIIHAHEPVGNDAAITLGIGTLRHFQVTIDQHDNLIRLHRSDSVIPLPPPLLGIGARLDTLGGRVVVVTVAAGGPVSHAGLATGDVVLEIDNHAAMDAMAPGALSMLTQRGTPIRFSVDRGGRVILTDVLPDILVR